MNGGVRNFLATEKKKTAKSINELCLIHLKTGCVQEIANQALNFE